MHFCIKLLKVFICKSVEHYSYDSIFWVRFFDILTANRGIFLSLSLVFSSSYLICYLVFHSIFYVLVKPSLK